MTTNGLSTPLQRTLPEMVIRRRVISLMTVDAAQSAGLVPLPAVLNRRFMFVRMLRKTWVPPVGRELMNCVLFRHVRAESFVMSWTRAIATDANVHWKPLLAPALKVPR